MVFLLGIEFYACEPCKNKVIANLILMNTVISLFLNHRGIASVTSYLPRKSTGYLMRPDCRHLNIYMENPHGNISNQKQTEPQNKHWH